MKKNLILVVSTLLLFCFLFSGCGGKDEALSKLMYGLKPSMTMQQVSDYFEEKGYEVTYGSYTTNLGSFETLQVTDTMLGYIDKYSVQDIVVTFRDGDFFDFVTIPSSSTTEITNYITSVFGKPDDIGYDIWYYKDYNIYLLNGTDCSFLHVGVVVE